MNIKLMLTRLQSAIGSHDLVEQMLLLPIATSSHDAATTKSLNLVVGYNKTPSSQTALDLTLWIAHQTRLATREQVTVHIVYVAESEGGYPDLDSALAAHSLVDRQQLELPEGYTLRSTTPILTEPKYPVLACSLQMTLIAPRFNTLCAQAKSFEQADQILERAKHLAQEWGGAFMTHVRVGEVATELRKVVESEAATLLCLGCHSVDHPVVQQLGANLPCAVLGIPQGLNQAEDNGTM